MHSRAVVYDLWVTGEPEPIGVTAQHPVWSRDLLSWVCVKDLREGERLLARDGTTPRVESLALRSGEEAVYTLEVDGDHCYRVGEQGLLVHNSSVYNEKPIVKDSSEATMYVVPARTYRLNRLGAAGRSGVRNLGVLVVDSQKKGTVYIPVGFPSDFKVGTASLHAEVDLIALLKADLGMLGCVTIKALFSERSPCDVCGPTLDQELGKLHLGNFDLYYIVKWVKGDIDSGGRLQMGYEDLDLPLT
jgi:hypothetical protein